jgi:hypothetical protein
MRYLAMPALPRKLSGRPSTAIRRDLHLAHQARLTACRVKLAMLRACGAIDGPWPPIADFPASQERGYASDHEVAQLMVLIASDLGQRIADALWRERAAQLYAVPMPVRVRTIA